MDPNILAEQQGLPKDDRQAGDAGTAYLRRLKKQGADALGLRDEISAAPPAPPVSDRRRSKRYECAGSVELRTENGGVRLWGTLRDISLHGCYVEMATTFPVDTKVTLALEAGGVWVYAEATVRASYPSLGMGMCFAQLGATQQARLREILAALAEKKVILGSQWRSS